MKTKSIFLISGFLALVIVFTSCLKNDDETWQLPPAGYVNVAHLSATTGPLDFEFVPNRINPYNFTYRNYSDYVRVTPGNRTFNVYKRGDNAALFTKSIGIDADKHYSLFIVDTASKMDVVLLRDSTRIANGDSLRIRFANMSPDVAALDFYVQGNNTPFATNIAYKSAGEFMSMKAGNSIKFEIRSSGSNNVLATSDVYNLSPGYVYTILSSGYQGLTSGDGPIRIGKLDLL